LNQPGDYVKAWRHVHDIFARVGATNATWIWNVNIIDSKSTPIAGLYPGDSYADWTAIDGYNKAKDTSSWLRFDQIYGQHPWTGHNTYRELLTVAGSKPIMVAETATTITGGDAGAWIKDTLLTQLPAHYPKIKALVWFNWDDNKGLPYPIESTPGQQTAFRQSIASSYYASNSFGSLSGGAIRPLPGPTTSTGKATRVNAGGAAYTGGDGRYWAGDSGFSDGSWYTTPAAIANASDDKLYQTEHNGHDFRYDVSLPNGTYTVVLKFAEIFWSSPGKRVFNVSINGQRVLTNFDILAQPNMARNQALDKQFKTTVTGGNLSIHFGAVKDIAKIDAIEILPD